MQERLITETLNQFADDQEATVAAMLELLKDWAAMLELLRRIEVEVTAAAVAPPQASETL